MFWNEDIVMVKLKIQHAIKLKVFELFISTLK